MKYRFFALIAIILVFQSCSRQKGKSQGYLPGTWQATPIVVDGDCGDWPSPYPAYDSKAMVGYATSNDKRNLYITVEAGDEMTELKILKRGLVVSIDTEGGKDAQFRINYPLENDNDPLEFPRKEDFQQSGNGSKIVQRQMSGKIRRGADEATQMSLEGFGGCSGGYLVVKGTSCGIKVIAKIDSFNELVWEAVIPFKAIYNIDTLTDKYRGKPISVCFAVKAFKYPESKTGGDNNTSNSMNNSMSTNGMNGRGMGSAGMGGRGTSNGAKTHENPLQHLYENTKTWKKFGLAYQ